MPPKSINIGLKLPFLEVSSSWEPNDVERRAAWELYIELVTRVAVVPLPYGDGSLREALTSRHSLFAATREILRRYGPAVAERKRDGEPNFGYLAVWMLNFGLRPTLTLWHGRLQSWEQRRPAGTSPIEHERRWIEAADLRTDLERSRRELAQFSAVLAEACDVPDLTSAVPGE
ncbi:hypothetical protein ACXR2U_09675 [Jatrophihabitans sp. YIM 134969]